MVLTNEKSTEDIALGIRRRVFFHTMKNNGGYLSQACSAAESLALLYNELLTLGEPTLPKVPLPFGAYPLPIIRMLSPVPDIMAPSGQVSTAFHLACPLCARHLFRAD